MLRKKTLIATVILSLAVSVPLILIYAGSVSTSNIALRVPLSSYRTRGDGNQSITFYIETEVSFRNAVIDPKVNSLTFSLTADGNFIGTLSVAESTFTGSDHCVVYTLNFLAENSTLAGSLSQSSTNAVLLTMSGQASALFNQREVSASGTAVIRDQPQEIVDYNCEQYITL